MDVEEYLLMRKSELLHEGNWQRIELSRKWTSTIPAEAGVYVLRESNELVYVGETGNLQGRMNDLLDSRHHTVRRTIGERMFAHYVNFSPATVKTKFPPHIEELVDNHIGSNLSIAFIKLSLGRKELEELIEAEIEKQFGLNKRGKRKNN